MRRAALLSASLAAACSDTPQMMPPPEPTITLDSLCSELARVDCDRLARCGLLAAPFDAEACLLRQASSRCEPIRAALAAGVASGELTFFELAARACRDHVGALDCTHGANVDWLAEPECLALVAGNAADGAACSFPFSCAAAGQACFAPSGCPGTCRSLRGNNETCDASEPCTDGFFCATPAMRCHAQVAVDAPCELSVAGNACVDGSFCDASQPGTPRCARGRGRNNGCRNDYECAAGLRCISSLCSGGQVGDTCTSSPDCTGLLQCASGRCVEPLAAGEECTSTAACKEGLACTSSAAATVCVVRPGTGDPCDTMVPCYLGRCVSGTCVAAAADGAACGAAEECLPGRTCTDSLCAAPAVACTR